MSKTTRNDPGVKAERFVNISLAFHPDSVRVAPVNSDVAFERARFLSRFARTDLFNPIFLTLFFISAVFSVFRDIARDA